MCTIDRVDATWLSQVLGKPVKSVSLVPLKCVGGLSCSHYKLELVYVNSTSASEQESNNKTTLFLKTTTDGDESSSVALGKTRESQFYSEMGTNSEIMQIIPRVHWSSCDPRTGQKLIIMEDLTANAVQTGLFFGQGSPLNWNKDLASLTAGVRLSECDIIDMAFSAAAKLHAAFWKCAELLQKPWLRGAEWHVGHGRSSWESSQQACKEMWQCADTRCWSSKVVRMVDASLSKINWEVCQRDIRSACWTLVHGDFHPANMLITKAEPRRLMMVDFEVIGVGDGAQDLGQYMISHVAPNIRHKVEHAAIERYYAALCMRNPQIAKEFTKERCWTNYAHGGAARWMWLLPLLAAKCNKSEAKYFHDQVLEFCNSHGIDEHNISMPRV